MTSGASTMPTNTLAAAETPTAPPRPIVRCSAHANARTTSGITPQWNSTADSAAMISTSGNARNASTKLAAGLVTSYGAGPPPRWPKTKPVPAASAFSRAVITPFRLASAAASGGIFSSARASRSGQRDPARHHPPWNAAAILGQRPAQREQDELRRTGSAVRTWLLFPPFASRSAAIGAQAPSGDSKLGSMLVMSVSPEQR